MTFDRRATAAAVAFGGALALAGPAAAQDTTPHLLSYEALPSVQVDVDFGPATYDDRAAITAEALETVMPQVFDILGVVASAATETMVTPGGYLLNTNASLQTEATVDGATADRIAAAAGWVFRQWSVLVTDFGNTDGGTGYAVVTFADGTLDADLAQAFFEHAASVAEGLGGGYTAFGDAMYFLNVRGPDGPYSGIEDADFIDLLDEAAGSFAEADPAVTESGEAEARFVGNDWEAASDGGDYLALLGGVDSDTVAALTPVREVWTARILEIADENGWR